MPVYVPMLPERVPNVSGLAVVGYFKAKGATHLTRTYGGRRHNLMGQHLWKKGSQPVGLRT